MDSGATLTESSQLVTYVEFFMESGVVVIDGNTDNVACVYISHACAYMHACIHIILYYLNFINKGFLYITIFTPHLYQLLVYVNFFLELLL